MILHPYRIGRSPLKQVAIVGRQIPFHRIEAGICLFISATLLSGPILKVFLLLSIKAMRVLYIHASMTNVQPTRATAGRRRERPGGDWVAMLAFHRFGLRDVSE